MKDLLGREIAIGDWVAYPTPSNVLKIEPPEE